MVIVTTQRERPLDVFVKAIKEAGNGIYPTLTLAEALQMTNLTSPHKDGWVMNDRLFGEQPTEYFASIPGLLADEVMLKWRGVTIGRLEKKVRSRKANKAEERVAQLMAGVMIVHQIRREELCVYGKDKINRMNRERPDLVTEVLDEIAALQGEFPAPQQLAEYKRRVVMSADSQRTS